jgi:hypothetical protein
VDGKGTGRTHACRATVGKPEVRKPAEDLDVDRVILEWILKYIILWAWIRFIGLRIGTRGRFL